MKRLGMTALFLGLGLAPLSAFAFPVRVSNAPENDLDLTVQAIESAQESLLVNIYELSSTEITNALVDRIQAGVHVEILEEGQPVGGMSAASRATQSRLVRAMQSCSSCRLFEMTSKTGPKRAKRRFRFDHAKYAVIDGDTLLIGSENYSPTGNPNAGTMGNRGWEVLMTNASLAKQFAKTFDADKDTSYKDVLELTSNRNSSYLSEKIDSKKSSQAELMKQLELVPFSSRHSGSGLSFNATSVKKITSPDTSLNDLTTAIRQARSTIDVEQMTFDSVWKSTSNGLSPLMDALLAAASRGVRVRVLLNDESVFDHFGKPARPKNGPSVDLLNQNGASARIADLRAMGVNYIHNKGMIIDGTLTLISSINWNENSVMRNREAAVLIKSADVGRYYEELFESDWEASNNLN
jgi:phosphatidylserine/phosphatidylglycerophosphate/cardiolipin synthase-like enzyme